LDERDGVCVHPKQEETVVTVETAQSINNLAANIEGVNNLAAIIEDKKNGSIDEITALKSVLNEQLRLVMTNIEDLDLKNQNVDSSIKVNVQEINLHEQSFASTKIMMDALTVEMNNRNALLGKQSVQIALLTEQLQNSMDTNEQLEAKFLSFVVGNKENVQQMSALEDELTDKMNMINEMSADIEHKNELLEEQSKEIALLQLSKAESVGLKTAVESLIASNSNSVEQIFVFEDDLGAMKTMLDEISVDIHNKSISLEEKTIENIGLTEQLQSKTAENADLVAEVQTLLTANMEKVLQISQLGDDLSAKTNVIDDMSADLTDKKTLIDKMSVDINQKNALLDEKSAEIAVLSERLQSMAEQFRLKTEVESDIMQQIAFLENDTIALKDSIDNMSAEIRQKDYLLEEKSTENVNLSKLLQLSAFENDSLKTEVESLVVTIQEHASEINSLKENLTAKTLAIDEKTIENADLTDRLHRSNAINESLEVENQVCVAVKKETDQQIAVLEDLLTANKISIDEMGAVIQQKNALLDEKLAEIAVLSERLQASMTDKYGLETEIKSLVASNKEHVDNIFTLNENLTTAKIKYDEINKDAQSKIALLGDKSVELVDLMGRFKLSEAKCDEHKVEMERMVAINEENIGKISLLEDENADLTDRLQRSKAMNKGLEAEIQAYVTVKKETDQLIDVLKDDLEARKTAIDEMSAVIKQKNALLEEKTAEIVDISYRLQISMAEKHGLKTEVESLVASNNEHVENIYTLTEDLGAKMIVIDEMSENIQSKIALLEEKSVEIADLTKRLHLSKAENDERQTEIDMKSAYINDITARLHAAMAESGELTATVELLIASNEEYVQKISISEDELATSKSAIVEMTADLYHKNELLEEKSLENDSMLKKLQESKTEIDEFKSMVETLIASKKEMSTIVHVNCSKDLENIESTLENMNEQNKTLQIQVKELSSINSATKEKNDELIKEVQRLETLLADERSVHDTMKTTLDLAVSQVEDCAVNGSAQTTTKAEMLEASIVDLENSHTEDEAREDAQNKHVLLQGTDELFNDKVIGVESLVESQHDLIEQFHCSKEENDKLKSAMLDLVTSNEENAQVISMLGEDVAEKNFMIEKMNQDIVELNTKCANLTEQLQRSTAKNEELDSEVKSLVTNNKAAKLFKAKNDRLKGEVQTLVANNKENVKQILLLEEELAAAKTVMAESIVEINGQNELFEERSAEIAELTEELAVSSAKTIELEAEIADLSERLEGAMTKIDWFEEYVESLVANSKENTHQIYVLENQVTAKNITIDVMTADIDNLRSMYNEIVAEFNELDEKFILAEAERDGLKKSVHDLEKTKSKYAGKIVTLQRGVKDVIDANGKLKEAKKSMKLQNAELLGEVNRMTKSLDVERSEMEEMNKILESEKALTAAIISTMENERNDLTDQLQLLKTERDDFEVALQTLMASNTESLQQKTLIEDDLAAKKIMIDEITASLEVKSAENTELTKQLQLLIAKHDLFKTEVRSLVARTKEDLATKTIMIDELTISLEEKSTENTELAEELKQFKVKTDVFKADVRTLVSLTKENVVQMSALEDELMVKKSMIGDISQEVKNLNMMCENMTAENTSLNEQVDLFKAECLGFKARIEDLESNITYYVKEVQNLALSLELAVNKVSTTDDELSQVTYSLYIERPNDNMQLHEMKKGLEHSVRKCEAKITEQKGTIDDLSKSLDSARVEIRNKNAVLEEKTGQIKEYLDVVDQVHMSDCGVGNFWTSAE
jgi:chromosome segregation ATPase